MPCRVKQLFCILGYLDFMLENEEAKKKKEGKNGWKAKGKNFETLNKQYNTNNNHLCK